MSVAITYACDGPECKKTIRTRALSVPSGWVKARGFITPEDRWPGQGPRPVLHFCPACAAKHGSTPGARTPGGQRARSPWR